MRQGFAVLGRFLCRMIPTVLALLILIMGAGASIAHAKAATDAETQMDTSADVNVALLAPETGLESQVDTSVESSTDAAVDDVITVEPTQTATIVEADTEPSSEAASGQYSADTQVEDALTEAVILAVDDTTASVAEVSLTGADAWFGSDHNGDGRTEVVVLYDLGNATTGLYVFEPTDSGFAAPQLVWTSGFGTWEWQQSKLVVTDHNGDGRTEVTVLYDLGNATTGLYVFEPTDSGFAAPQRVWTSSPGAWNWRQSELVATDRNGDNRTEVTALYDLGNAVLGLYVFEPTDSGFAAPQRVWMSGPGGLDLRHCKPLVTDHNGDTLTEISLLYNLGNRSACLWVFEPTGSGFAAPQKVWTSGFGTWDWLQSKLEVTDHDGNNRTEITVLYDLGRVTTGLYVFEPTDSGFAAPQRVWASGFGTWDWRQSKTIGYHFKRKTTFSGILYLDMNLSGQVLSAIGVKITEVALGYYLYATNVIFSTTTSTGGPGMETPTGRFRVYSKHVAIDMSGPGYYAPDVPYVLWFYGPYSIHGTYWHNDFGWPHSHGCVNLPTPAARWLFYRVPVGMTVIVHY